MKQLPGSTGALRSGPGTRIEGRELEGYELFGGQVRAVEDPAQRPVFRNITLHGCTVRDCILEGALLEDVLIDGMTAPEDDHMRVFGCVYRRVVLRGHFANITLLPTLGVWAVASGLKALYQRANGEQWVELICDGDWALDISGLTGSLDFRSAVPARLVRRDPETQIVMTAEQAARADWRSVPGLQRSLLGVHINLLQGSGYRDTILIADKSAPDRARQVAMLRQLQRMGAAQPD
ncbi:MULTISPECIES: hypothetical protein [Streptomyces]|uniref:hypothetical protein n=1 Tax=Streptomyces TaxID=1883 RepID=UPI0011626D5D|nr:MULTISPECIES: hypothetical protein [Streptomyces]MCX4612619.1 hypothetical protein [Streptomyces mirabilis]MCX5352842.1 hypothetical protein [Streptomyces mirabilis]NMI61790.1 hypothetical protein [Streptomyces sp. RLA2-12]QDN60863.1 hypothetical protein FNV67_41150 [Streptomyces sp. S1D4-20]QDN70917.1 hypothetical protein FNV66_40010 [Streptomyces sp. S1D4-14]